ncbi:L-serine ammonia-lyase, partial [Escherichia coli]|nr:L-serine ammonia-lyase [Escherichia coli]
FRTGDELLALDERTGKSIAELMGENERAWHTEAETRAGLLKIWDAMQSCVTRGCSPELLDTCLPGPFQV